jgi:hypothetical protein
MKVLLLSSCVLVVSCSSKPFDVRNASQEAFSGGSQVCPGLMKETKTRKDAAYCLGWMYVQSTDKKIPKIDELAFRDLKAGDPATPYIWTAVATGAISPYSPTELGASGDFSRSEWEDSLEKMKEAMKRWEKNSVSLRLK